MTRENFFGYSVNLVRLSERDGGGWLAEVPELKGCLSDGESPDEALENLKDVIETWLDVAREEGRDIPDPKIYLDSEFSGKFTLRIPKTLHRKLAQQADIEGVSLNAYVTSLIAYNFGEKSQEPKDKGEPTAKTLISKAIPAIPYETVQPPEHYGNLIYNPTFRWQ